MFIRGFLVAVASLFLCEATLAQNISARLDWYGVYTSKSSKALDDPTSPTGKRSMTTPVPPTSNTDRIPGTNGVRFGFSYTLTGRPGTTIMVKHVYRFPPAGMPDKIAGGTRSTVESTRQDKIGQSALIGWSFQGAPPERIVFGEWAMEVWADGRKLAEKRFTVYKP